MAHSTFVTLPVPLSGSLPIRSDAGFSSRNLDSNLYSKAVMHSGDVRVALLTLKFRVVSFWTQNKIVSLAAAPPVRLTSPFSHRSSSHRFVLIVCRHFVNDVIALKFCDNTHNLMRFPPTSIFYGYHL